MAAEITLFADVGKGGSANAQVARGPLLSKTATFTPLDSYIMRVYANAAPVVLTINSVTWTIPTGVVEWYGIDVGKQVTVA